MELLLGDCLEKLKELEDNSIDSIVTDPPYGISFMGKKWDYDVPQVEVWKEVLRVLKPGGHALVACGTRTQHRMAVNLEDAGFEIRDIVAWIYGSGFPKSLNIGKVMDKFLKTGNASWNGTGDSSNGALGYSKLQHKQDYRPEDYSNRHQNKAEITEDRAKQWEGWGTALKPAMELWTLCRKPLEEKTVAENCLKYGVGGINIDGCRVETTDTYKANGMKSLGVMHDDNWKPKEIEQEMSSLGRFPANLIHDGSEEVVGLFPQTKSGGGNKNSVNNQENSFLGTGFGGTGSKTDWRIDSGSASRFFYCAKASKRERNIGCEGLELTRHADRNIDDGVGGDNPRNRTNTPKQNFHPTVKPVALMRYLCKLITPQGGVILDPYMGSGTTGIGAKLEGFDFIGIEREEDYIKIAQARIEAWEKDPQLNML